VKADLDNPAFQAIGTVAEQHALPVGHRTHGSNVIKATGASVEASTPAPEGKNHDDPEIIVHRTNGVVDRVEFVCKCGRSSEIRIEYDGE
jgi:hypothetical protein